MFGETAERAVSKQKIQEVFLAVFALFGLLGIFCFVLCLKWPRRDIF